MDWRWLLFSFRGRISHRTFVTRGVLALAGVALCTLLAFWFWFEFVTTASAPRWLVWFSFLLLLVLAVLTLWLEIALTVKRLHDRNRTGWLFALYAVPVLSLWPTIEAYFLRGKRASNAYGEPWPHETKTWFGTISLGLVALLVSLLFPALIRWFIAQPFSLPSASNEPTLLIGDYVFVSKSAYGYSRYSFPYALLPFRGRIFAAEPSRGDMVVFKLPADNSTDYMKRIVGLPGDRIQMHNGVPVINGVPVTHTRIADYVENVSGSAHRVLRYRETLPNGVGYNILDREPQGQLDNTQIFTVPAGHYFVIGDNRDNSDDSRAGVGYVPFENLIGRAEIVWYSTRGQAPFWELWKLRDDIRWARLGTLIH